MDRKERQIIATYYERFSTRTFDEKDVIGFLSIIQKKEDNPLIIQELSEFIINREQYTDTVKTYFVSCMTIIENAGKQKGRKKIELLYSFKDIRNGFNSLFSQLKFEKVSMDVINDMLLCIISLLQSVPITSGTQTVGQLSFAASSKQLFLMGMIKTKHLGKTIPVTFPVLAVQNSYEKITPRDAYDSPYLFEEELIEVINHEGKPVITFPTINS